MNESSGIVPSKAELEELTLLLENRTFVDYFNIFLCLPVFGQHVFYNYMDMEFEFEPPIRNRRHLYLDRREVLRWLCTERLRAFKRSTLYIEYNLCMLLRNTAVELPGLKYESGQDTSVFTRNVIGTARGMMLFRESMRGTGGENVYRCWKDIEKWRLTEDLVDKKYWRHVIYTLYINDNSSVEVVSKLKVKLLHGALNLDQVPESDVHEKILDAVTDCKFHFFAETDEALLNLQTIQLYALRKYWLPRHLLHIMQTVDKGPLGMLMKPAPGDVEYVGHERRFRCKYMFPTIYKDSSINSPATTVLVSQSADDLVKNATKTSSLSSISDDDFEAQDEEKVEPTDLFSIWGGPAKEIETERVSTLSDYPSPPETVTPDEIGGRKLKSYNIGTDAHVTSPIPIVLTSYLGGKKRTLIGNLPNTTNRVIWSLASDTLAGIPFREFMEQNGKVLDLKYLGFWTDVRNYLDADEQATDCHGRPLKLQLAHRIADVYLSKDGEGSDIFSETLKMSLFTAISTNNDLSLLCMTQDIVQKSLWEPMKLYVQDERRRFLNQVRGARYKLNKKQRQAIDQAANHARAKSARYTADVDPEYFFNCVTLDTESVNSSVFSPAIPCDPAMSCSSTSYHISITEEQMFKAMELAVLCSEYGVPMMMPQYLTKPSQLVDILYSDYGSLHVNRVPTVRHGYLMFLESLLMCYTSFGKDDSFTYLNMFIEYLCLQLFRMFTLEWLKDLLEKPKINIETLKVSRKVLWNPIDISSMKKEDVVPKVRGRMIRRPGVNIERPRKPKSLIEVLSTPLQFDFFKRFMMMHKMTLPVLFWKAVEELQDISNAKARQSRVVQILRKFFGKYAKYGTSLDCDEEIIRQIPNLDKVTPGILMCAQAAVFRSLERKWYPSYSDTFPPDSAKSSENSISYSVQTGIVKNFEGAADFVAKTKKAKKRATGNRRTLALWKNFSRALTTFVKAVTSKAESQLFEMFLKYEVEREKQSPQKEPTGQMPQAERSTVTANAQANVQTRVVVRNRLIIMNRLPSDLRFFTEVRKYQNLVDSAMQKGDVSAQENEFFTDKAKSIISCYLASEIQPRVQVNISNDMALNITNTLASDGPKRGSFHDAMISIFPILYHFYKKFSNEWMKGNIPDEYFDSIENTLHDHVGTTPHRELDVPSFTALKPSEIKTTTQFSHDENLMRIHFSISDGVTMIYPQAKQLKTPTATGRRMTKHSLHALTEQVSAHKETGGGNGDKKDSPRAVKGGDKQNKHADGKKHSTSSIKDRKKSEKIVVKESEHMPSLPLKEKKGSIDKARRLSFLVESFNMEKQEKIREQNRLFSKIMSFDEVVSAAMAELPIERPDSNSTNSLKESSRE